MYEYMDALRRAAKRSFASIISSNSTSNGESNVTQSEKDKEIGDYLKRITKLANRLHDYQFISIRVDALKVLLRNEE
jgi:hypothetical protein